MDLDCIVTNGFPVPAFPHGLSQKLAFACMYTFVFNSMDLPTGQFPVSTVKEDEQYYESKENPNELITKTCRKALENSKGMPLGIQVSTLPYEDEKCLTIMKHFQELTDFRDNLPVKNIDFKGLPKMPQAFE